MKSWIKKIIGSNNLKKIRPVMHGIKSWMSAFFLGFPADKLKLIGINATKGKTSTTIFTGRLMNLLGVKTGYISTAIINTTGNKADEKLNTHKMTTLDGSVMQKLLKEMVDNNCKFVVLEMSSQGMEQNRHWGLGKFFMAVFMNLYPEHIQAHGGLDNYVKAKQKLFSNLAPNGIFIANADKSQEKYTKKMQQAIKVARYQSVLVSEGKNFEIKKEKNTKILVLDNQYQITFNLQVANFELVNLVYAYNIVINSISNQDTSKLVQLLPNVLGLPGRMEWVVKNGIQVFEENTGSGIEIKNTPVSIMVDYAHEPESLKQMLLTLQEWKDGGLFSVIIHILSVDGAGRDDWKKPVMGNLSYLNTDFTILTTDNYDQNDNPQDIVNLMSKSFVKTEKHSITNLSTTYPQLIHNLSTTYPQVAKAWLAEINRKKAMQLALQIAMGINQQDSKHKILIVSTGVGTEQGLTQPAGVIPWDERKVWVEIFNNLQIS